MRQRIFQNSSLPVQNDLLNPGLANVHNQNPALSSAHPADNEVEDYGDDDYGAQSYNPLLRKSQLGSGWHDPNQNGYYQPQHNYLSPDPAVQHAFDQERYAARLANYYQMVAEQNAKKCRR